MACWHKGTWWMRSSSTKVFNVRWVLSDFSADLKCQGAVRPEGIKLSPSLQVCALILILSARWQRDKQFVRWVARSSCGAFHTDNVCGKCPKWQRTLCQRSTLLFPPIPGESCGCEPGAAKPEMQPVRCSLQHFYKSLGRIAGSELKRLQSPEKEEMGNLKHHFCVNSRGQALMCTPHRNTGNCWPSQQTCGHFLQLPIVSYHLAGLVYVEAEAIVITAPH